MPYSSLSQAYGQAQMHTDGARDLPTGARWSVRHAVRFFNARRTRPVCRYAPLYGYTHGQGNMKMNSRPSPAVRVWHVLKFRSSVACALSRSLVACALLQSQHRKHSAHIHPSSSAAAPPACSAASAGLSFVVSEARGEQNIGSWLELQATHTCRCMFDDVIFWMI